MARCDCLGPQCLDWHVKPHLRNARPNEEHPGAYVADCPVCGTNMSVAVGERQRIVVCCHHKPACTWLAIRAALIRDGVPVDCLGVPKQDEAELVDQIDALYQKDMGMAERQWRVYSLIKGLGGELPPPRKYPGGRRGFFRDSRVSFRQGYDSAGPHR